MNFGPLALAMSLALPGRPADPPVIVWFELAHRVVARLAEGRLSPEVREAVRDILAGQSMADASAWADGIRGSRRETSALHFVNIPLAADRYDPSRDCTGGRCIIAAIEDERSVLADPSATPLERAEALRFLIHFMGDLHQPLHVADNDDKGGNLTQVRLNGRGTNLHRLWDGEMIDTRGETEDALVARLGRMMAGLDLPAMERGSVADWAMEGHRIAAEEAYQVPGNRMLGDRYLANGLATSDLAIIRAGVRLASVLNQALAAYRPRPPAPALGPGIYRDREAAAHVGEEATVVGILVTVNRTGSGNIYLNFGADYPHQTFSGAVLKPGEVDYGSLRELVGKRVGIKGVIRLYRGQPEIVVDRREQIVVIE